MEPEKEELLLRHLSEATVHTLCLSIPALRLHLLVDQIRAFGCGPFEKIALLDAVMIAQGHALQLGGEYEQIVKLLKNK